MRTVDTSNIARSNEHQFRRLSKARVVTVRRHVIYNKKSQHANSPKYKTVAKLHPQVQTQEEHIATYTL